MNAGLQSLMATPPVIRYFLQDQSESVVSHNLVEQFSMFVSKFWSGQFSILYPKDLKTALGHIHGQFKDYRQVNLIIIPDKGILHTCIRLNSWLKMIAFWSFCINMQKVIEVSLMCKITIEVKA